MSIESSPQLRSYRYIEQGKPYDLMGAPYFPSFAYREFLEGHPQTENRPFYASMAITSGGYKRDADLDIANVVAKNTEYGALLREYLAANNLGPEDVVIPSELGSMRQAYWGQLDFLMLWYHVIAGVHERDASRIEAKLRRDGVYKDAKWAQQDLLGETSDEKWAAYVRFTDGYARALQDEGVTKYAHRPVKGMFGALDGEMSLGGKAERLLAQHLGVPFYTIEAQEQSVSREFQEELHLLTQLGAQAVHLFSEEGPRLIFRPRV